MKMTNTNSYLIWVCIFGIVASSVRSQVSSGVVNNGSDALSDANNSPRATASPKDPSSYASGRASNLKEIEDERVTNSTNVFDEEFELTTSFNSFLRLSQSSTMTSEKVFLGCQKKDVCSDDGAKDVPGSLIKCQCEGDEVLVDGQCQPYEGEVQIDAEYDFSFTHTVNVSSYTVIIKDVTCDEKSRFMEFSRGQFHLRDRGDIVLLESAGDLNGQRISKYCVSHFLDETGGLTWTLKACVPVPAVPRCCPPGQAMKAGSCQPANTPDVFQPPIAAKPFDNSIQWPTITNFVCPVTCTAKPLITIPLSHKASHLVSLANGLYIGWIPDESTGRTEFYKPSEYCVDGVQEEDGSVMYYTSFCHGDPKEMHEKICKNGPCFRRCCKEGFAMDLSRYSCTCHPNVTFEPPTAKDLDHYNMPIGWPMCTPVTKVDGEITIDEYGYLIHEGMRLPPTDYCVDAFVEGSLQEQSALACLSKTTQWEKARQIVFPVCNFISLVFLFILFACHLLAPKLLKNGGVHQLCHAMALSIAYSSSFSVFVFRDYLGNSGCFIVAIIMQFGFLTTFFWLNIMCFEIWRKIRTLKLFRACKSYPSWPYMLYAWGIPFLIGVITVLMQFYAPDNVCGVIKPYIGFSRCWFRDDLELFVYFYGPIAFLFVCNSILLLLTYVNYKQMLMSYKETTQCLKDLGTGITSVSPRSTSSMPSRQLADHVNDYKQRLKLFVLMATCWVTEVLSWKIEPLELWAPTDTLNSLQGFVIFIIFLSNRNKRKQLEEKFPGIFKLARRIKLPKALKSFFGINLSSMSPMNSIASKVSKKLSNSTLMSSFTSSLTSSSTSTFSVSSPTQMSRSESLDESESGIVVLSHSPLRGSKSS